MEVNTVIINKAAQVYMAINHDLRKKIFRYLQENGPTKVTDLYRHFGIEQSVASQHLAILRRQAFVITKRENRFIYYSANLERLGRVQELSKELLKEPN
jgi:ArsR family transcriptional regulator, virulence genes transcriptional regulator